jgi:pimeloyl-ACP methyl ester carboxylesterase
MSRATVNGLSLNYEVLGDHGPWIVLTGGGRMDLEVFRPLGEHFANAGYRVVIHDRRNCGASDISITGEGSEEELFADDTYELLKQLGALPVYACGGAAGCRMSILLALRHPDAVRGLLLWWPSGGKHATQTLAQNYYGQYIKTAQEGGMAAVCETPYYSERIEQNPGNRERLMSIEAEDFIETMTRWRQFFLDSVDLPLIGVTEDAARSIKLPTCIIPGGDDIHPREVGENLGRLIPNAEMHHLPPRPTVEAGPGQEETSRSERQRPYADVFLPFLEKIAATTPG